eukprot:TRINITY_DN13567_c0_g1_i1.p2 TRINITY_DN13567_c0_g1~~TRINITY_DN13567_c0_g1_i1.p2  ORF type:complete len:101 (+),score=15.14 TRINITY_DN13567_c0_g1_i1:206-508(+)
MIEHSYLQSYVHRNILSFSITIIYHICTSFNAFSHPIFFSQINSCFPAYLKTNSQNTPLNKPQSSPQEISKPPSYKPQTAFETTSRQTSNSPQTNLKQPS